MELTVDLNDPQTKYALENGYSVELLSYFPDFEFKENGEPTTKTRIPNNPAFVFKMTTPDKPEGEVSFVAIKQTIEPMGENEYKMAFTGIETRNVTALTVRKDLTFGIIDMRWNYLYDRCYTRSILESSSNLDQEKNDEVWIAAHTNKNWYGLKRDIESVLVEATPLNEPTDQLEREKWIRGEQ